MNFLKKFIFGCVEKIENKRIELELKFLEDWEKTIQEVDSEKKDKYSLARRFAMRKEGIKQLEKYANKNNEIKLFVDKLKNEIDVIIEEYNKNKKLTDIFL